MIYYSYTMEALGLDYRDRFLYYIILIYTDIDTIRPKLKQVGSHFFGEFICTSLHKEL